MSLEARIDAARGAFRLAVELDVADRELVAVLGPNGAGKSTLLAAIAGLAPLESGRIVLDGAPLDDPGLRRLALRLRSLGLVGLDVALQPTADHLAALVQLLADTERHRDGGADAVVEGIALETGGTVKAVPLRTDNLRLVRGTAPPPAAGTGASPDALAKKDAPLDWREMLARACDGGLEEPEVQELAQSFEAALGVKPSGAQWDAMIEVWSRQLSRASAEASTTGGPTCGPAPAAPGAPGVPGAPGAPGAGRPAGDGRIDAVGQFLTALSPNLSQRLLSETIHDRLVPEPLVLALAQRLPATVVLGALSAVDRDNGQPSQAAMALLRKVSAQAGTQARAHAPRTNQELADTAAALERLLQSKNESAYVPEEYLRRRAELSRSAVASDGGAFGCPTPQETTRHAAELVLQILAAPDADAGQLFAAVGFAGTRIIPWVRGGELVRAAEAMTSARALCEHAEPQVAGAARSVVATPLSVDDLLEGVRQYDGGPRRAVGAISDMLRQCDGSVLASLLKSGRLKASAAPAGGPRAGATATAASEDDIITKAIKGALTVAPDHCLRGLFDTVGDTVPPALLALLDHLAPEAHLKAVAVAVPHATPALRRALIQQLFKRNIPWPIELTESMLRDASRDLRRLAVMRLVRDADLPTVARHLDAACLTDEYEADVAVGLAELLHPRRKHPDVRTAWRHWFWSGRRWATLFSVSLTRKKRAT